MLFNNRTLVIAMSLLVIASSALLMLRHNGIDTLSGVLVGIIIAIPLVMRGKRRRI